MYYNNIIPHECTGVWSSIAPLRILSFDIECEGRQGIPFIKVLIIVTIHAMANWPTGHFPDPQFDPVIQIANIC